MKQVVQVVVALVVLSALLRMCSARIACPDPEAPTGFEAAATPEDRIRAAAPDEFEAWQAAIAAHEAARDRLRAVALAEFAAWRAAEAKAVSANVELEVADAGWADPEDAVGRSAWEKATERIKIADAALEAAKEWLQASAPVEFAAFEAAHTDMRATALRATVDALRAASPAEFAALEGLDAALQAAGQEVRAVRMGEPEWWTARAKGDTVWEARKQALETLQAAAPVEFAAWDEARQAVE